MNKKTITILCIVAALVVVAVALSLVLLFREVPTKPGNSTGPSNAIVDITEGTGEGNSFIPPETDQIGDVDISFGVGTLPGVGRDPVGTTKPGTQATTDPTTETTTEGTIEETTEATTEGEEETTPIQTPSQGNSNLPLTYEEFQAMSGEEQFEFANKLGIVEYIKWKKAAIADYNARHPDETIDADGPVIDLGG